MATDRHARRRAKLIRTLRKHGAGAILVTNESNVTWLTGFTGDSTRLFLSPTAAVLISDTRYTTQIADECEGLDVEIRDASGTPAELTARVVQKAKPKNLAIESDSLSHAASVALIGSLPQMELLPTRGLIEELRAVKDAGEIREIRSAIMMAERGMATLRAGLQPAMKEREIAHNLEHAMRGFGAERAAFDPIVAVGPQAALPHARPGDSLISDSGVLLVDWGAETPGGYRSDLTRVLVTGKISPKVETVYRVVLQAQLAAIAAIGPGVSCRDVDAVARTIIAEAGFGKYFGHGLGHGIGLDIHEQPRFSPISEQVLEPGMVITVEPGIYLPGRFGVRIEDDVLVTRDGCEVLTSVPKEFEDAFVEFLTVGP